jgi:hypothetical protein
LGPELDTNGKSRDRRRSGKNLTKFNALEAPARPPGFLGGTWKLAGLGRLRPDGPNHACFGAKCASRRRFPNHKFGPMASSGKRKISPSRGIKKQETSLQNETHIAEPNGGTLPKLIALLVVVLGLAAVGAYVVYGSDMWNPPQAKSAY